ncbi:MAG: PadR family transcriptional regulator [Brevinematales bacterium]|jgi:DNA-binding PadR family transcriptional regulator|nr:PadR family transcriptional regulator [Brevinematales bacterium]
MKYSNVELIILHLIHEKKSLSGYEINRLVEERGYRNWAEIGTSSIYIGLEKLENKGLVISSLDTQKQGKGPLPKKYTLTRDGEKTLLEEMRKALTGEADIPGRFTIGLSGLILFSIEESIVYLGQKKEHLAKQIASQKDQWEAIGGQKAPFHVWALFRHTTYMLEKELEFVDQLITDLKNLL